VVANGVVLATQARRAHARAGASGADAAASACPHHQGVQLGSKTLTAWPSTCADAGHKLQFTSNGAFICGCEFGFNIDQATGGCTPPVTNTSNSSGASTVTVSGGKTVIAGSALFTDAVSVAGTLSVAGTTTLSGNTTVAGTLTVGSTAAACTVAACTPPTLSVAGTNTTLSGTLTVNGWVVSEPPLCFGVGLSLQYKNGWSCVCLFTGLSNATPASCAPPVCNATNSYGLLWITTPSPQFVCSCLPRYNKTTGCTTCLDGYSYTQPAAAGGAGSCTPTPPPP
jgi:hypothetical protein